MAIDKQKVLVVDDEPKLVRLVKEVLTATGFDVISVGDGNSAIEAITMENPDLVLLDIVLADEFDGYQVAQRVREFSDIPIIMLTAKVRESDLIRGFDAGADDYITKPFSIMELLARVKAILRRVETLKTERHDEISSAIHAGGLIVDTAKRTVTLNGRNIDLTAREFDLLLYFARHPGRAFTRSQLLDNVWGYGHEGYEHTVNSHINRLRSKIEKDPAHPRYILTVWGIGYKFADFGKEEF